MRPLTLPPLGTHIRVLLVWPEYPSCYWTFGKTLDMHGWKAVTPPLGLITVAAMCPEQWELRLIDEAVEPLREEDILWADLVMVSAMHVQKAGVERVLRLARSLGRRTIIGGPYASSKPEGLTPLADHVVVGEPDEMFGKIARDLEQGTAEPLYTVTRKPDVTSTPAPRFDLLKLDRYSAMAVQFSRGCPFQCDFCDIITIYGRKPRTKPPQQLIRELDELRRLGWNREVFIVDDNFIGNHKRALELVNELHLWHEQHNYPFSFLTEASVNLAQKQDLLEGMVKANFLVVFMGIESPSEESLKETRKYQNLTHDLLTSIRTIQEAGLWVMGGFVVGFDSDDEKIFERQFQFIEEAAIPWAMIATLQALPTTPLYARMEEEERLFNDAHFEKFGLGRVDLPNFKTKLPFAKLVGGYRDLLSNLYQEDVFFPRALRSLEHWRPRRPQTPPPMPLLDKLRIVSRSIWRQGIQSTYRASYWRTLATLIARWWNDPVRLFWGFAILASAEHFLSYSKEVVGQLNAILELDSRRVLERPLEISV